MSKRKQLYSMFSSIIYKRYNPEKVLSNIYKKDVNDIISKKNNIKSISYVYKKKIILN